MSCAIAAGLPMNTRLPAVDSEPPEHEDAVGGFGSGGTKCCFHAIRFVSVFMAVKSPVPRNVGARPELMRPVKPLPPTYRLDAFGIAFSAWRVFPEQV